MYTIVNLDSKQEKMQHILKKMTVIKSRQLTPSELEQIYLYLVKMINITNCHTDFFKDISKALFVINHYYQIENSQYLLLESLHLCKLNLIQDNEYKTQINYCINLVGNFEINTDLIQVVTNVLLIAEHYLTQCLDTITPSQFSDFILTSLNSDSFVNSAFYLSIAAYLDETSDANNDIKHQFKRIEKLLDIKYNYWNYSEFINWYFV